MKEYHHRAIIRGVQLTMVVCAKTMKTACNLMDTTPYMIKTYGGVYDPPITKEAQEQPLCRFVILDGSGELPHYDPNLRNRVMKYIYFDFFINEYRKQYPTYRHLIKSKGR